jgi:hypothetical protein
MKGGAMNTRVRQLGLVVILFGVIALAMGIVFVQQGFAKEAWLVQAMETEQIEMPDGSGTIVNDSQLAQAAGDLVREPRPMESSWEESTLTPPTPRR